MRKPTLTGTKLLALHKKHDGEHFRSTGAKWQKSLGEEDASWMAGDSFLGGYDAAMGHPKMAALADLMAASKELSDALDAWGPTDDPRAEAARDKLSLQILVVEHLVKHPRVATPEFYRVMQDAVAETA